MRIHCAERVVKDVNVSICITTQGQMLEACCSRSCSCDARQRPLRPAFSEACCLKQVMADRLLCDASLCSMRRSQS